MMDPATSAIGHLNDLSSLAPTASFDSNTLETIILKPALTA
jgi:hypothetical protein